jgi:hypothetical protein
MKKLLLTAAAILTTLNMYGQGTGSLTFGTIGVPTDKRVWVNDTGVVGQGTLAGAGFAVALYWGRSGITDDRNMTQIGASATTFSGQYNGSGRTINYVDSDGVPGTPDVNGAVLSFQVRGWSTAGGSTYEEVLARNDSNFRVGKNAIFELKTKDANNSLETPPNIADAVRSPGYRGFALTPVPEPSVIGLGLLGAGALLLLRRRK